MINLKIKGGLGNQLFQYAVARNLAIKNNVNINIDYSYYNQATPDTPRQYLLDLFKVKVADNHSANSVYEKIHLLHKVLRKIGFKTRLYAKKYYFENGVGFDQRVLELKDHIWLTGFFQSYKYFSSIDDILREEFKLRATFPVNSNITETESVFIHIRRGDYVSNNAASRFFSLCSLDYYEGAIKLMKEKLTDPKFFIFSDDISWVKNNLKLDEAVYVSDGLLQDFEELSLMSRCRHAIIANSSFSWWGAWLINNKDKIVVAPSKWFTNVKINTKDLIPETWIRL